ncbi:MAG: CBS domain-containing protein [Candidatus Geothermincolia bacterium]
MKVREIMSGDVITASPDTEVKELARVMLDRRIGSIPIVDDSGKVLGLVTEGDLVHQDARIHFPTFFHLLEGYLMLPGSMRRFEEDLRKAAGARARDVMEDDPRVVIPDTDIESVATLLAAKDAHAVLVTDMEKLVGIVTRSDILKTIAGD